MIFFISSLYLVFSILLTVLSISPDWIPKSLIRFLLLFTTSSLLYILLKSTFKAKRSTNFFDRNLLFFKSLSLFFFGFVIYFFLVRLAVEPFGMWDSWAIWNQKAKSIFFEFEEFQLIPLIHANWSHPSYPLGLPLFLSGLAILLGEWSEFYSTLSSLVLLFIIIYKTYTLNFQNKKNNYSVIAISIAISLILSTNFEILKLFSDLCADSWIAFWVFAVMLTLLQKTKMKHALKLGILLACLAITKNEGILLSGIFLCLTFYLHLKTIKKQKIFYFIRIICPYLISLAIVFIWKFNAGEFISADFQNTARVSLSEKFALHIGPIGNYFFSFQIFKAKGLVLLLFIISFFIRDRRLRTNAIGIFLILILYNGIYLITNSDINWHLSTSYDRIHVVLLPSTFLLLNYAFGIYNKGIQRNLF
jgi:hypothetical protein